MTGSLRTGDHIFPFLRQLKSLATFFHPLLCYAAASLRTPGRISRILDRSQALPVCARDPSLRLKNGSGQDDAYGQGEVGARLTWLSARCLSSYLIFSASSSDQQAAVRFAGARLG